MLKTIAVFALAAGLAGCASSPFSQAPVANVTPTNSAYARPGIPQSQYECMTDEGYGRAFPCGTMH